MLRDLERELDEPEDDLDLEEDGARPFFFFLPLSINVKNFK
jgi:hypothetical protein